MSHLNKSFRTTDLFCFLIVVLLIVQGSSAFHGNSEADNSPQVVFNPYENVDRPSFSRHKAALHVHTLQSDGYHMLNDVVHAYRDAGFIILAITVHDWNYPNARVGWVHVPEDKASPYPANLKPDNFRIMASSMPRIFCCLAATPGCAPKFP